QRLPRDQQSGGRRRRRASRPRARRGVRWDQAREGLQAGVRSGPDHSTAGHRHTLDTEGLASELRAVPHAGRTHMPTLRPGRFLRRMVMMLRTLFTTLAALSLVLWAGGIAAADDTKAGTHAGTVVKAADGQLTMSRHHP